MKKFILKSFIFSIIFCFCITGFILIVKAWSGIKASNGDKVTTSKWNELVGYIIKENSGKSISSNGLYCGSTAATNGNFGGYVGGKALCETACGDPLAHMCDAHELILSKQVGITTPSFNRYASLTRTLLDASHTVNDCFGRTNSTATTYAGAYTTATNRASADRCSTPHPIACCK